MMFKFFYLMGCVALLFSCSSPKEQGFVVGTNAEFPPFTFREKGEIVGFDIDVAKEVAKRLGQNIQFKDMPFDALIPDVVLGKVDFVAAGMSFTEERAKRVIFTKSYVTADPIVIFSKAPIKMDELFQHRVIVNEGYTADLYLSAQPNLTLTRLASPADAFLALKSGRADAFVTALSTVDSFLASKGSFKDFQYTVIPDTSDNCALVISKKRSELFVPIQEALDAMEMDGTLTQLRQKWNLEMKLAQKETSTKNGLAND